MRRYSSMEMMLERSRTMAMALSESVIFILRDRRNPLHQFFNLVNISAKIQIFQIY
jgi:hypothetical protein